MYVQKKKIEFVNSRYFTVLELKPVPLMTAQSGSHIGMRILFITEKKKKNLWQELRCLCMKALVQVRMRETEYLCETRSRNFHVDRANF